jgi:hypothetical protein
VFVCGALLSGVSAALSGGATAADGTNYRVIERRGALVVVADGDGDIWHCHYAGENVYDFAPTESACKRVAGALGGPLEPLGRATFVAAAVGCNGAVIPLYRQHFVVGYSCLIGGAP